MDRGWVVTLGVLALVASVLVVGATTLTGSTHESPPLQFSEESVDRGFQYLATNGLVMTRGGGTYVADVDNDGWQDVLAVGGRVRLPPEKQYYRNHRELFEVGEPILMLNENGSFRATRLALPDRFEDQRVISALFLDFDNDGWDDLVLFPLEARPLVLHNRNGSFAAVDEPFPATFEEPQGATTADFDGDGCLDLFVFQNGDWNDRNPAARKSPDMAVPTDNGLPNAVFRGDCAGGFEPIKDSGIVGARWSLAASAVDFTGDGRPDIHVANDYNHDFLYVNEGDGTFRSVRLGGSTDRNAMSSEVADVNADGAPDVFVTNIYFNESDIRDPYFGEYLEDRIGDRLAGNSLLMNDGAGEFAEAAPVYGVDRGGWGWAAAFRDFDNDGNLDLVHATKHFDGTYLDAPTGGYLTHPAVFEGRDGRFAALNASRVGFEGTDGLGLAALDFDRDGRQDLVIGTFMYERFGLYRNDAPAGNWLQVDLSASSGRPAIGARVEVTVDDRTTTRFHTARADFLSQDSRVLHFGLGTTEMVDQIRVLWPDGAETSIESIDANRRLHVTRDGVTVMAPGTGVDSDGTS